MNILKLNGHLEKKINNEKFSGEIYSQKQPNECIGNFDYDVLWIPKENIRVFYGKIQMNGTSQKDMFWIRQNKWNLWFGENEIYHIHGHYKFPKLSLTKTRRIKNHPYIRK